jgi:hypothetical protein
MTNRDRIDPHSSARDIVQRAGLPPPRWDVPVDDAGGKPHGSVTGSWDLFPQSRP